MYDDDKSTVVLLGEKSKERKQEIEDFKEYEPNEEATRIKNSYKNYKDLPRRRSSLVIANSIQKRKTSIDSTADSSLFLANVRRNSGVVTTLAPSAPSKTKKRAFWGRYPTSFVKFLKKSKFFFLKKMSSSYTTTVDQGDRTVVIDGPLRDTMNRVFLGNLSERKVFYHAGLGHLQIYKIKMVDQSDGVALKMSDGFVFSFTKDHLLAMGRNINI